MPKKQHVIELNAGERDELEAIVTRGAHQARTIRRAQALLWSEAGKTDGEIAQLQGVTPETRPKWGQGNQRVYESIRVLNLTLHFEHHPAPAHFCVVSF